MANQNQALLLAPVIDNYTMSIRNASKEVGIRFRGSFHAGLRYFSSTNRHCKLVEE